MPEVDGVEATKQIKESRPDTRILVLTSFASDDKVFPAIQAGASGYLLKDCSPIELVDAIRQVYNGESWIHPVVARRLLQEFIGRSSPSQKNPIDNPLTNRELTVLRLLTQGKSNLDIADDLKISEPTVRKHVSNILTKLHLESRTQAALYALRKGISSLDEII
jgi:NarL family two-component system response regulator LiaR